MTETQTFGHHRFRCYQFHGRSRADHLLLQFIGCRMKLNLFAVVLCLEQVVSASHLAVLSRKDMSEEW